MKQMFNFNCLLFMKFATSVRYAINLTFDRFIIETVCFVNSGLLQVQFNYTY
jgi:hypothetical protein